MSRINFGDNAMPLILNYSLIFVATRTCTCICVTKIIFLWFQMAIKIYFFVQFSSKHFKRNRVVIFRLLVLRLKPFEIWMCTNDRFEIISTTCLHEIGVKNVCEKQKLFTLVKFTTTTEFIFWSLHENVSHLLILMRIFASLYCFSLSPSFLRPKFQHTRTPNSVKIYPKYLLELRFSSTQNGFTN